MEVHVPHDVISNHILPRIPAKSVCRLICVSKEWHSFLTSDTFKNKFNDCHIEDHENNLKHLFLSKTETSFEFATIDCEVPRRRKGLTPTRRPLPSFEAITPPGIRILASFHGLICLGIQETSPDVYSHLFLWNPLTSEYKKLSKSTPFINGYSWYSGSIFGLYYSSCEDDYKLLYVYYNDNNGYIYSLKSDSWRKADVFQSTRILDYGRWSPGTYLNENLFFVKEDSKRLCSVIRFDTKNERLSKIKTPSVNYRKNASYYFATIMVKSDGIHVCVKYDRSGDNGFGTTTCIKLWKLDEYDYENMKEVLTYQLRPFFYGYDHTISYLRPFHLMKNRKWLMMMNNCWSSYNDLGIYKVDIKKKMCITNKGKGKEKGYIYDDFAYVKVRTDEYTNMIFLHNQGVRYIETFVSPNR